MRQTFGGVWRQLALVVFAVLAVGAQAVLAQNAAPEQEVERNWQVVITNQIEAFREGDAAAALELAGATFKRNYSDPDRFMQDILSWGYAPILESTSHSFGDFRPGGEGVVLQIVQVIGRDQGYYEAMYQLAYEEDGWRIYGVALSQKQGVGI